MSAAEGRPDPDAVRALVQAEAQRAGRAQALIGDPPRLAAYAWAAGAIGVTTAVGALLVDRVDLADLAMLFLLAIMVASLGGRGPALLAAALSVASFDFFFVPPRLTFQVADARHMITFAVMFLVGLAISTLVVRLRREEADARLREGKTAALLAFTRDVGVVEDIGDIAAVVVRHLQEVFPVSAAVLAPDADGGLAAIAGLEPLAAQEVTVARWAFDHRHVAGEGTDTLPGARLLAVPMIAGDAAVGVVVVQPRRGTRPFSAEQRHLLDALIGQAALALGRARLAAEARDAALRASTEELRSTLLSAVSHDLRTPLAGITGAATTLRDDTGALPAGQRAELLDSICDEAQRLERILRNLLDLTRVEAGLEVDRQWVPVDEVVGSALTRLEDALAGRPVTVAVAADLPLIAIDPVLIEQVLVNLLENALKHTPAGTALEVAARRGDGVIELEVADRGPGLPAGAGDQVFDRFYQGPGSRRGGVGLGLAVCRGIVAAHGGTIVARDRPGGGAVFRLALPAREPPPTVPGEELGTATAPPSPPTALVEAR